MTATNNRDDLFAKPLNAVADFNFDAQVARVFPDMIKRSVPGYTTLIALTGVLARHYAQAESQIYDLGCSLGASTLSMRHRIDKPGCRLIAIDNSTAMIARCKQHIDMDSADIPVDLLCADLRDVHITNASFVTLNFTLQFIPVEQRLSLLHTIYAGLNDGGALLLSEKVVFADTERNQLLNDLHIEFKRAQGYSELEIAQKRAAIENVLIPETIEQHQQRLQQAGFRASYVWFQSLNFVSLLAVK